MTRRDNEPTAGRREHPTWLAERCPDWCVRDHAEDDHPDDRYHQSEGSLVPGVVATRFAIPLTAALERLDLITWIGRYAGEREDWLVIEPTVQREPRLMITLETARGLVEQLSQQLARHDGS